AIESARAEAAAVAADLGIHLRHLQADGNELRTRLQSSDAEAQALGAELAIVRAQNLRLEGSVTVQLVRKLGGRFYSTVGERSLLARAAHASLRLLGRVVMRPSSDAPRPKARRDDAAPLIELPQFERPTASLVIPV